MALDSRFLDILCCPLSKRPLLALGKARLAALNRAIAGGGVQTVAGEPVGHALSAGLITDDGKVIYRIDDGIPVLLSEEGIGTLQLPDFPA